MAQTHLYYRGKALTAPKLNLCGTQRTTSLEQTWSKISPLMHEVGITRVANITGLDRVGIPVTAVIRPHSKSLTVSSGKGPTLLAAQVSGVMESYELYCAEEHQPETIHLPYCTLSQHFETIPLSLLPLRKNSLFHPTWPERWVLGWDLFAQKEVAVPLFSVSLNMQLKNQTPTEISSFSIDSNGLASGNHIAEAITSAIYELIERDAITCHAVATKCSSFFSPQVRQETIHYPIVRGFLEKFARAKIDCFLYDCTVDTEVPVFKAIVFDPTLRHGEIVAGYGAHLDPEIAMIRAISEAAQGRPVYISGARDDILSPTVESWNVQKTAAHLKKQKATIDAKIYRSQTCGTFEEDISLLMQKLKQAGLNQLIVYDLSQENSGVYVVQVIIPGLEGCYLKKCKPGKRAQAFTQEMACGPQLTSDVLFFPVHSPAGGLI